MRLMRTAAGGFINADRIVKLVDERGETADFWVATAVPFPEPHEAKKISREE